MKIFRLIIAILLSLSIVITVFVGKDKIAEQIEIVESKEYKGIISLWHIDGFEGGTGSRKQFLLKVAREFEKQNPGVLIMVINHTFSSAKEGLDKGDYPDLISYSNGLELSGLIELTCNRATKGGYIGNKLYATSWCCGGYTLIKNPNAVDKKQDTVIVSQAEFTQPILAMMLEGLEFDNIEVYEPLDAYIKFTSNKITYFLGTQRDIVRLNNRGIEVESTPLTAYNDLYQYISLTGLDAKKNVYASRFIDFLVSDRVQSQLNTICMFSPYIAVKNDIEHLSNFNANKEFKSIPAFYPAQTLKEMQEITLSAIRGNQNDINKIKNMLI